MSCVLHDMSAAFLLSSVCLSRPRHYSQTECGNGKQRQSMLLDGYQIWQQSKTFDSISVVAWPCFDDLYHYFGFFGCSKVSQTQHAGVS